MQLTDEREADFIIKVDNDDEASFIVHAEVQSTNDSKMLKRRLEKCQLLHTICH
ncbi:MAG: hypothetical protein HQL03_04890 [Nitrospirae bacterium]|nr:hypothetical protein [Nitrospirota bacterium]MBF0593127.1 hypothetical protein [Nitrospirota bacterium]